MNTKFIIEQCNIYEYPKTIYSPKGTMTIGDLHGNSVKFLFFLIQNGVIGFKEEFIPEKAYSNFVAIYEQFSKTLTFRFEKKELIKKLEREMTECQNNIKCADLFFKNTKEEKQRFYNLKYKKQITTIELRRGLDEFVSLEDLLIAFDELINTLEIKNDKVAIRLIGDEVADRGCCDYFTLRLLHMLHVNAVDITILLSNHGIEFIAAYENLCMGKVLDPLDIIRNDQKTSFFGLSYLIEDKLIDSKELISLVNSCYKPNLKLIDYTLNQGGIKLFTHAPVDFTIIFHLCNEFEVHFNESTKESLGSTIDKINTIFQQIVSKNGVNLFLNMSEYPEQNLKHLEDYIDSFPILYVAWNRFNELKDTLEKRPDHLNYYDIEYVHGHDEYVSSLPHVFNLNTFCGKYPIAIEQEKRELASKIVHHPTLANLEKQDTIEHIKKIQEFIQMESTEVQLECTYTIDYIVEEFELLTQISTQIFTELEDDSSEQSELDLDLPFQKIM